jgi:glutamate formiminotransferase/formiminotetrahydrofolate cyclodeaminase
MPRKSDEEKKARKEAIQEATREAISIPFRVMEVCLEAMSICLEMAETGNPNSVSDAGVGALALRSAVKGAYLNVLINTPDLEDKSYVEKVIEEGRKIQESCEVMELEILQRVEDKL